MRCHFLSRSRADGAARPTVRCCWTIRVWNRRPNYRKMTHECVDVHDDSSLIRSLPQPSGSGGKVTSVDTLMPRQIDSAALLGATQHEKKGAVRSSGDPTVPIDSIGRLYVHQGQPHLVQPIATSLYAFGDVRVQNTEMSTSSQFRPLPPSSFTLTSPPDASSSGSAEAPSNNAVSTPSSPSISSDERI